MNIVFFISDISSSGGTERISFLVANYFVNLGHTVNFISLKMNKSQLSFDLHPSIKIDVIRKRRVNLVADILILRKLINSFNVDILIDVDAVLTPYSFIAKLFKKNIKHIVWELFNAGFNLGVKRRDIGRILGSKFADKCVVLTFEDKIFWQQKYKAKNLEVIYNPVTNKYAKKPSKYEPSEKKIILGVGRLAKQKGFDLLLQAWQKLPSDVRSKAILQIAGDGPEKNYLLEFVKHHRLDSSVQFLGYCSNLDQIFQPAYAYVLSSRFEGFVLSLLEAMASGLPVISYDCPCGPKELLVNNSGVLVENGNILALSQALEKIILESDYRNLLAEKSYDRSLDFKPEVILPQWQKLITGLYD